ncbi:MAG TPA: type II toxin-antitoxin system HipA family toxin [Gammaproteobacteria bacterium]|nr:type II toxin-antitoxin system HipA family toxin [Gammaproteobacteria bacterium]
MKNKSQRLKILMNGWLVGHLEKNVGSYRFSYDEDWLNLPESRPISLSLPLSSKPFANDIVYNFFDNLLPDNPAVRALIQTKFHLPINQPFEILSAIGKDCIGALQFASEDYHFKKEICCEPLTKKDIALILKNINTSPLGMSELHNEFRISLAGVQEKTALLFHQGKWQRPLGSTPTTHIFKLPIGLIRNQQIDLSESCENEWLCAQIAEAFGLAVAKCEIQVFDDVKALIVERFDRRMASDNTWLMRLPQEDMCQALGLSSHLKYQADGGPGIEKIMSLLLGSSNAIKDRDDFFRAQILFWLLAAIDGHAKNFSIYLEPNGNYRLTPFYDLISAHPLLVKKQLQLKKIKMAMALKGKNLHYHWNDLQRRYFLETAKSVHYSVKKTEIIMEEMLDSVELVIEKVSSKLPSSFPEYIAQSIFKGMRSAKDRLINRHYG